MDQFYYIKQYLKTIFQLLKTSKRMFLRNLKHFKKVRFDQSVFILLIAV
jgi:hypothetical protein